MSDHIGGIALFLAAAVITAYCVRCYRREIPVPYTLDHPSAQPLTADERAWETELAAARGSQYVDVEWWLRNQGGES